MVEQCVLIRKDQKPLAREASRAGRSIAALDGGRPSDNVGAKPILQNYKIITEFTAEA